MTALLGLLGFFGAIVSAVILLINKIRKRPKWKALVALCICFVMFIGAFATDSKGEVVNETTEATAESTTEQAEDIDAELLMFELVAGEQGEYGEMFTINKGTEFEETYFIYRVPAGTYTVTNIGEYMGQVSVCSDEIVKNESGWEECADVPYAKAFSIGESDTVTIAEGYYVEIHEPANFSFVLLPIE